MPKKVRVNAKVNTGLNWFFKAFAPEILENALLMKKRKLEKLARKRTQSTSRNPKRLLRLKQRKKPPKLKQLG